MKSKVEPPKLNLIAAILEKRERSQRFLARKLGISANTVNSYCVQRSQPPLDRLFQIAEILDVPITELINVDYKPKPKI
jgi:transcriptional regulator with XRE-family HTH domain